MWKQWSWFVYILECKDSSLYVGMTWNLDTRMYQHASGSGSKYVSTHGFNRLIYFEEYTDIQEARAREYQLKGWRREKKWQLVRGEL